MQANRGGTALLMAKRSWREGAIVFALLAATTLQAGCSGPAALDRGSRATAPAAATAAVARAIATAGEAAATPLPSPTPLPPPATTPLPAVAPSPALQPAELGLIAAAAKVVRPAVVSIATEQTILDLWRGRSYSQQTGAGSGVIFDRQGYILTNYHVVAGGDRLKVSLPDGRSFAGELVGGDRHSDLAVVRIQGDDLPVAPLGSSDALQIGEWVVAIGNALDLRGGPTVTAGVVGALGRSIEETADDGSTIVLYDLIQTDAAINPGNSGGPLVNLRGEVVGINTAIAGILASGIQAQGIGYAIAINSARPVVEQLIATGRMIWPSLGINFVALTPSLASVQRLPVGRGVIVLGVAPGGPAAQAGLRRGDIITRVAGEQVEDEVTFLKAVRKHKPGDKVAITVVRADRSVDLAIVLGSLAD